MREAARLLKEAGFEVRDRKLVDLKGQPVSVEFLSADQGDERRLLFYKPYLERLGMTVNIRTVDSVQYENRLRNFDFDIITACMGTVAVAGQRAARLSSDRRRPIGPGRATFRASRIRLSTP